MARVEGGGSEAEGGGAARFEPYLSTIAQNVVRNPIRKVMLKMQQHPGCLSLAGGRPCKATFPDEVQAWGQGEELIMNYGPALAVGTPEIRAWAQEFVQKFHAPPGMQNRDVLMTSGNTDGITKTIMLLSDPGDVLLADEVTYPALQATALPLGRRVLGVQLDEQGMKPERLEAALQGLEKGAHARILYMVPHGQNPTGATLSDARKDALYALARKYDLTILEDDPYVFMRLTPKDPQGPLEEENMRGAEDVPRSFLARDTDGRVVRLDSVSKFLCPGYRLGWVTGGKALLAKWSVLAEVFTWSVSGVQQRALLSTMRKLGDEGLHRHLQRLQCTYAKHRGFLLAACERHLAGLCRWQTPEFGMFFWLEVLGCPDTSEIVEDLIESYGVAMVPGSSFSTPEGASGRSASFFRVSFSLCEEVMADKAMKQLRAFLLAKAYPAAGPSRTSGEAGGGAKRPPSELEPEGELGKAAAKAIKVAA